MKRSSKTTLLLLVLNLLGASPVTRADECKRTVLIGDSQMAYGVTPFKMGKTFDGEEFRRFSQEAFGTRLFRYFAGTACFESTFHFSQGGSGVYDWLGEALVDQKPFPGVRFLGGS
ncbi:hypothetical protein EB061_09955, partial [bacterium]|nr:hypothetical protein [bacterium]